MICKIIYQLTAIDDIEDIFNYILENTHSLDDARDYIKKILNQIDALGFFPKLGHHLNNPQLCSKNLRSLTLNDYVIYYEYTKNKVEILHVCHSKKLPPWK